MPRNGNRPGEGAAHSVGNLFDATEATSPPNRTQAQCQAGSDNRRPGSTADADFQRLGLYPAPAELRHYCRNPRCRMKLPAPVENTHRAFCTRGCYESFYRNRCRVCERNLRKTGKCGDAARMYCRPPANCRRDAEKWPEKYRGGQWVGFTETKLRSAHSTGTTGATRPGWWWGGDGDRDHSLYDRDGLTIARVVLEGDGRYHLQKPIAIPRQAWAHLEEAKRGAESFALMAMPLEAVDPKLAARIKRNNETPHPMGLAP
jgi:hypothetical protein